MNQQDLFNIITGVCGMLGGWWLHTIWGEVKALREQDQNIQSRIGAVEVLVAGQYVRRDDLDKLSNMIFEYLRRIEDVVKHKADKP